MDLAKDYSKASSWEDTFLQWFAGQNNLLVEKSLQVGGLHYHHFQNHFTLNDGRQCASFGSSENRKLALIKCAAESIERQVMSDYFKSNNKIPKAFQNSNGWAVHQSEAKAAQASANEAMERHLLLKSFFSLGWNGFSLVQKIIHPEVDLYFLTSRFVSGEQVAGIVVAKSPTHLGVSFGYCVGNIQDTGKTSFWQQAIFEAADKILLLNGSSHDENYGEGSWIKEGIKYFLETPFDLSVLEKQSIQASIQCFSRRPETITFDLQKEMGLDFSLLAAFSFGTETIPLFSKKNLDAVASDYLKTILAANKILEIPDRHPIS